ncbi:MAG TPA: alpha/beta fold hydrolase [Desulfopila sp.]|nr:alpha/beta fold hydrolase [Desulfopila sp.]
MHVFLQLLLLAILVYGAILICISVLQRKMIFFPVHTRHPLQPAEATGFCLERSGAVLRGWLFNEQFASSKMIIYYGGNSEDIYLNREQFSSFVDIAVLLVNYRGYGTSTGTPGEKEFYEDALAVFDEVSARHAPPELFLMGRSLGSAVASYVASQREVSAIILVTPFDSLETLAKKLYPFLPISLILRHKFHAAQHLKGVNTPALILYAGRDRIVPGLSTERLVMHMHMKKKVVCIEEAEHNTIDLYDEYQLALLQFITTATEQQDTLHQEEDYI